MTLSPSPSLESSPNSDSRPSSSTSGSTSPSHAPPQSFQSGLPSSLGGRTFALRDAMGTVGTRSAPRHILSSSPPDRQRQTSEESLRPTSSTSSPQNMEEEGPGPSGSSPSEPGPSRQKKKRTRTLTTPHQSAVLHALLAQSRFPTTAIREEVGRSIGLSARKVQVWFQNQRQKARKPRGQNTSPLDHTPQLGVFSSSSQSETASVARLPGPAGQPQGENQSGSLSHQVPISERSHTVAGFRQHSLPDDTRRLIAQSASRALQPYQYPSVSYSGPSHVRGGPSNPTPVYPAPPQSPSYGSQAPYSIRPYARPQALEPPIVLPPLRFDHPSGAQTLPPPPIPRNEPPFAMGASRHSPMAHSSLAPNISLGSAAPFSPPITLPPPPSRHLEGVPPPFALQPTSQWGLPPISGSTPTLPPPLGFAQSSGSSSGRSRHHRTNSDPPRALPPLSNLFHPNRPHDQPQPWSYPNVPSITAGIGRRFDPVHSVLREEEYHPTEQSTEQSMEDVRDSVTRTNRHTYDFTRPSGSMLTPTLPPKPDGSSEADPPQND